MHKIWAFVRLLYFGDDMKIGIPKAMLYYRYGTLWETFFEELGCDIIISGDTNLAIMEEGTAECVGECCLPTKVFMGHVASLIGRCDYILVPRFEQFAKDEEFCVRFWGMPDIVKSTFPKAPLLTYNLQGQKPGSELHGFFNMARCLGKKRTEALGAYAHAKERQRSEDAMKREYQSCIMLSPQISVLLVSQPYIIHDPYIGAPLVKLIRREGVLPIFSDHCSRRICRKLSREISQDLYWTMNKEEIGAIPLLRQYVDGIILVTAFPCGTDSLVNELVMRRVSGIPITNIVLDDQQGEAGLETRIESFLDIIKAGGQSRGGGRKFA